MGEKVMDLKGLLEKSVSDCTDEELVRKANMLSKLKIKKPPGKKSSAAPKSNKDKRVSDLLKGMSKEQKDKFLKMMMAEG